LRSMAINQQQNSMLLTTPSWNLKVIGASADYDPATHSTFVKIEVGDVSNLVQVAHFNGRYYLRNGYHRAYAFAKAGVTHIPAVVLEMPDYGSTLGGGAGFVQPLMESPQAPTMQHFVDGRAYPVTLRADRKALTVTWLEHPYLDFG